MTASPIRKSSRYMTGMLTYRVRGMVMTARLVLRLLASGV